MNNELSITESEVNKFWDFHTDPQAFMSRFPTHEEIQNACKVLNFMLHTMPKNEKMEMYSMWVASTYQKYQLLAR